jgi:tetratricopeptide (TPR) repeat protein
MIRVVFALLLLLGFAGAAPTVAADRFSEIAHQAEQARSSDHLTEALRLYREGVRLRPTWSEGWRSLGSIYYDQDRFSEAHEAFRRYTATGKDVDPAYAFLGLCEYETRDYEHAIEHLGYWVQKGSPGPVQLVDVATVRWAELLTRKGRFLESLYLLDKQVAKYGPQPALVEAMGLAWMRMQNTPEEYPPERREIVWLAGSAGASMSAQKFD